MTKLNMPVLSWAQTPGLCPWWGPHQPEATLIVLLHTHICQGWHTYDVIGCMQGRQLSTRFYYHC